MATTWQHGIPAHTAVVPAARARRGRRRAVSAPAALAVSQLSSRRGSLVSHLNLGNMAAANECTAVAQESARALNSDDTHSDQEFDALFGVAAALNRVRSLSEQCAAAAVFKPPAPEEVAEMFARYGCLWAKEELMRTSKELGPEISEVAAQWLKHSDSSCASPGIKSVEVSCQSPRGCVATGRLSPLSAGKRSWKDLHRSRKTFRTYYCPTASRELRL